MRDQAIGQPDLSLALAEPTRHVRRRWIIGLTLASLGMWMATQTPLQVMLALQLQDITPRHKIVALGAKDLGIINIAIVCPGAIGAAIAAPLVSLAGYPALFVATAVVAIAASIGVWRIKSVQ